MYEIMFITGLRESQLPANREFIDSCLKRNDLEVVKWAYVFQDFGIWGNYFRVGYNNDIPYEEVNEAIKWFHDRGFLVGFYVDVAECENRVVEPFLDSVLQSDWVNVPTWKMSRMSLDPKKSWYRYLKAGMTELLYKYPIDGIGIDRADVVGQSRQFTIRGMRETKWLCKLLDEVREWAGGDVPYVCNSLWEWQTEVARRAYFLGSDGVCGYEDSEQLVEWIREYQRLSQFTELHKCYINPTDGADRPGDCRQNRLLQWPNLMKYNKFTFFDTWNFQDLNTVLS